MNRYRNRSEAGKEIAKQLLSLALYKDSVVLAIPRGGIPVAYEIAIALDSPLDICLIRKLRVPEHPELALGAIAQEGKCILNISMVNEFTISEQQIKQIIAQERKALIQCEQIYKYERSHSNIAHQSVILVDDGLATGSTMQAAITFIQMQQPSLITVAVPVGEASVCNEFKAKVDQMICPLQPQYLMSVGYWYEDFSQISDTEVLNILAQAKAKIN